MSLESHGIPPSAMTREVDDTLLVLGQHQSDFICCGIQSPQGFQHHARQDIFDPFWHFLGESERGWGIPFWYGKVGNRGEMILEYGILLDT